MWPVNGAVGNVAEIWVAESTVNAAAFPPIDTLVAPVNPVPVMTTFVPVMPPAGENDEIFKPGTAAIPPAELTTASPTAATTASDSLQTFLDIPTTPVFRDQIPGSVVF